MAQWDPVSEIILDSRVAQQDKNGAMRLLGLRADDLPNSVADRLREAYTSGPIRGVSSFVDQPEDLAEAAFTLGLALGAADSAAAVQRILAWLRGSASQRQDAARLVSVLGRRAQDPVIHGALVMLTADPQYQVRAAAAASLIRGLDDVPADIVEAAITAAAREPGCRVPLAVARASHVAPQAWSARTQLQTELQHHMSATVRAAASHRTT